MPRYFVTLIVAVALFMETMDSTIIATSLPAIAADLIVAGWTASFVYDTAPGAEATVQLIEYANTQLLEFRFYDELLTRTLREVYRMLDEGTGFWRRWRLKGDRAVS